MEPKIHVTQSNYEEVLLEHIGRRRKYLCDDDVLITENLLKEDAPVVILMNDIKEPPSYEDYKIIAHGITPCGMKTTLLITNIKPYADVEYIADMSKQENLTRVKKLLSSSRIKGKMNGRSPKVIGLKQVSGRKLIGFSEDEQDFIRVYFSNLQSRKAFIESLIEVGIPTYNNDLSSYYRVVAREYKLNLAGWNTVSDYVRTTSKAVYKTPYILTADIGNVKPLDIEDKGVISELPYREELFQYDKSIAMCWDIEQYSSDFDPDNMYRNTRLPSGKIEADHIFNIGATFHFHASKGSILKTSIIIGDVQPGEDYLTICCDKEKTVILVWATLVELMMPEFIVEFNGTGFDWPNVWDKTKLLNIRYPMCKKLSLKRIDAKEVEEASADVFVYKTENIKVSADRKAQPMANIRLHGYVAFDIRVLLMQLNSTESKSSLKFFLEIYGLGSKLDMPIPVLFKHYHDRDYKGLGEVAHYCCVDSSLLHDLILKTNLTSDRRAVGVMSYTSMFDAIYRANGCKVRNLIVANALSEGLFYNAEPIRKEEDKITGKYPGALVLKPRRGLINPPMTFEEFCRERLDIHDENLWAEGKQLLKPVLNHMFAD